MRADPTHAPFLPMEEHQFQGYEAFYKLDESFEVTQYHCHDYYELYIHIRGGEYMGVDNRLFQLKPNQVFILPPFCMHGLSCTKEMRNYERSYLNLSPEVMRVLSCGQIDLDQFFRSHTSGGVCTYQLTDQDASQYVAWIRRIRDNQVKHADENDAFHRFENYTLLMNILNLLCRTMRRTEPVEGEVFGNSVIQEVLEYINNHYTQPIRIENLARSFGVSVLAFPRVHAVHQPQRLRLRPLSPGHARPAADARGRFPQRYRLSVRVQRLFQLPPFLHEDRGRIPQQVPQGTPPVFQEGTGPAYEIMIFLIRRVPVVGTRL